MSDDPPERHFFRALGRHRLLWLIVVACGLFLVAAIGRLNHWAGWWP